MAPSTAPLDSHPRYRELPPGAALAPWVECFWAMRSLGARSVPNRVLPDGCSDIIIGLGDAPGPVVVGTMRTAAVHAPSGPVDYFGVRFRPGAGLRFLDVPLDELTDRRVPLDELWGGDARALADVAPDARPARAAELERAFDLCVGLSPKVLGRVLRFRRAIDRIERGGVPDVRSWTAIAFDCGYADQPHLIREFRALAGVTPAQYAAERHGVGFVQYPEAAGT